MRIVNRTTGLRATLPDSVGLLALSIWLMFRESWTYGALSALAFMLDGAMAQPNRRNVHFGSMALVAAAIAAVVRGGIWIDIGETFWSSALAAAMCVAFAPVLLSAASLASVGDDTNEPLSGKRVRAAQMLALLSGVMPAVWNGAHGLVHMLPLWAGALGASAYRLRRKSAR
jgi:hypothetical protein